MYHAQTTHDEQDHGGACDVEIVLLLVVLNHPGTSTDVCRRLGIHPDHHSAVEIVLRRCHERGWLKTMEQDEDDETWVLTTAGFAKARSDAQVLARSTTKSQ